MPNLCSQVVERSAIIAAPPDVIYDIAADQATWPQFHRPAVHAEVLERGQNGTLVQHWAVTGPSTVRTWQARWQWDPAQHRMAFEHTDPPPPLQMLRGEWSAKLLPDGSTRVTLWHEFAVEASEAEKAPFIAKEMASNVQGLLDTVRDTAQRRAQLESLVISFEDSLFIAGSVKDAYAYLYEADKWPDRIPHVSRLALEETTPNVQFFDMDTKTPDGAAHTTRSVRICLPHRLIVYKQTILPGLLDAHTGHWSFTETPEGVIASARHTATIKPSALHLLGAGTTVNDARKYLRRVLSANSLGNLRLAKEFAEERAGV